MRVPFRTELRLGHRRERRAQRLHGFIHRRLLRGRRDARRRLDRTVAVVAVTPVAVVALDDALRAAHVRENRIHGTRVSHCRVGCNHGRREIHADERRVETGEYTRDARASAIRAVVDACGAVFSGADSSKEFEIDASIGDA